MGLFDKLTTKSNTINYYTDRTLKVLNDFFGLNSGSVSMAKQIEAYGTNPIVFSIINYISGVSDGVEKQLLQGDNEVENGDVYDVLYQLNEEKLYQNLLATGNAFLRLVKGVGMGAEFEVLNSKDVEILLSADNMSVKGYGYCIGGNDYVYPEEEILHIKFSNIVNTNSTNWVYGFSPLEAGMKIVTASTEIFNAEAAIFKNRGIIGMLSSGNDMPLMPEDIQPIQEAFDTRAGGSDKFNKVLVTSSNAKYVQMGMSPSDLQLIDNQINKLRFLCALYGIDSKLLGDGANSTYNNVREAQKALYINTVLPLTKRVNKKLIKFLNNEYNTDYTYETNETKIDVLKEEQTLEQMILERIAERDMSLEELLVIQNPQQASTTVEPIEDSSNIDSLEDAPAAQSENALAQANLRGSVGGVQGILAIQTAISQGTASESAAITTLIEIYGFDNETARQILGL
jgi:HK97 family phage portal protein